MSDQTSVEVTIVNQNPSLLYSRDLLATVKKLQDENRKLATSLAAAHEQSRDSAFSEDGEDEQAGMRIEKSTLIHNCSFQRHILR